MCSSTDERASTVLAHAARVFRCPDELEREVCGFVEEGLAMGERVLLLAPRDRLGSLERRLGAAEPEFTDMTDVGLNPARIIPAIADWVERGSLPARVVSEPLWEGRSDAEIVEVMRHEALVEAALGEVPARMLCSYLEDMLPACAPASLERSHDALGPAGESVRERRIEAHRIGELLGAGHPLEPPSEPVQQLPVTADLSRMRREVGASHAAAALSPAQRSDFVLAVNEVASNALEHGRPPRVLRLWRDGESVVAEVDGEGRIEDPLVGRRRPSPQAHHGRGLWMVNQLCDLVELRSSRSHTTLRMRMRCA